MLDTPGELFGYVRKQQPWADPKVVKVVGTCFSCRQYFSISLFETLDFTFAHNCTVFYFCQEKAIVEEAAPPKPSEEEFNPFLVFPLPEENFKVMSDMKAISYVFYLVVLFLFIHLLFVGGEHCNELTAFRCQNFCDFFNLIIVLIYRFDDTNPEAEKKEYIDHIKEIVGWMGWEPFKA
ncbi:hypothetical protein BUALT_Bualt05G0124100 [Buddleja alternifolia]|uniref:Glutamyl/glutaminyl-tRNA synthetase class Ib catalytic domain-containing protein n=1 Tax=Buddleja alternifolia TaxID=168488 RepID=A0AAV6XK55_9LAMI|nr:hypothetical protein BUALT_Bualt05G0124100 [Buddleja alternifolia]